MALAALALALSSAADAQEQKPGIAFADTSTISLECPTKGKATKQLEIQNQTSQAQMVELRLSPLRDEDGVVFDASEVCGGVTITSPADIEDGGLSGFVTISASKSPPGGETVYTGTVAAFAAGAPVVRRPLEVREAAASANANPLVTAVEATVYRGRPWGDEHIEVPVSVNPDKELALTDNEVVGALAGGGDSGVVTYVGKHKLANETTDVELAAHDLGPDDYEGDVDLVPGADEGKVTLKLTVKDWWLFPAFVVLIGIITGLVVQRWLNVSLPKGRLFDRVDRAGTRLNEATARLKESADASGKPWGSFTLNDVKRRQDTVRRQIKDETKLYYLGIDPKVIEALEAKIKPLEDDIDLLDTVREKMTALDDALEALRSYPRDRLPLSDEEKQTEPLLAKTGVDLLKGEPMSATELKQRLADADATAKAATDMAGLLDWTTQLYATLRELSQHGGADLKKELKPSFDDLQSTTYALWRVPNAKQLTTLDAGPDLVKIHKAIADAVAKYNVPDERGGTTITTAPVPVNYAFELSKSGYAITLGMRASDGEPSGEEFGPLDEEAAEVIVDDAAVKAARRQGYGVAAIALAVALVTAMGALYIDKPFGTFWDYVSALTWGLATQAVLSTLAIAIGGVAGLRALGSRISGV